MNLELNITCTKWSMKINTRINNVIKWADHRKNNGNLLLLQIKNTNEGSKHINKWFFTNTTELYKDREYNSKDGKAIANVMRIIWNNIAKITIVFKFKGKINDNTTLTLLKTNKTINNIEI